MPVGRKRAVFPPTGLTPDYGTLEATEFEITPCRLEDACDPRINPSLLTHVGQ